MSNRDERSQSHCWAGNRVLLHRDEVYEVEFRTLKEAKETSAKCGQFLQGLTCHEMKLSGKMVVG